MKQERREGDGRQVNRQAKKKGKKEGKPKIQAALASPSTALTETLQNKDCLYLLSGSLHKM